MGLKENQLLFLSQTIQQLSPLKHLVFYFVFSQLIQCIFKTVKPDQSHCYRTFQMGIFDLGHLKKKLWLVPFIMKTKPWLWSWKMKDQNCDIWSGSHSCDVDLKNAMHIGNKQQTSNLFESDLVSKKSADSWCYPTFPGRRCIWKMAAQRRGADTAAQSPHLQLTGTEVLWFKPGAVFR